MMKKERVVISISEQIGALASRSSAEIYPQHLSENWRISYNLSLFQVGMFGCVALLQIEYQYYLKNNTQLSVNEKKELCNETIKRI